MSRTQSSVSPRNRRTKFTWVKVGKWLSVQHKVSREATEKHMAWLIDRKHFDHRRKEKPGSASIQRRERSEEGAIHEGWKHGSGAARPLEVAGIVGPAALAAYLLVRQPRLHELRTAA